MLRSSMRLVDLRQPESKLRRLRQQWIGTSIGLILLLATGACGGESEGQELTPTSAIVATTEAIADHTATSVAAIAPSPALTAESTVLLPTPVPLREGLAFPTTTIAYPPDAPPATQLPPAFALVAVQSGSVAMSSANGWSGQYRFGGTVEEAVAQLEDFFQSQGWSTERLPMSHQDVLLLMEEPSGSGSGSALIGVGEGERNALVLLTLGL